MRICARCGKNLDLVGTAHNCLPVTRSYDEPTLRQLINEEDMKPQPKPVRKTRGKKR